MKYSPELEAWEVRTITDRMQTLSYRIKHFDSSDKLSKEIHELDVKELKILQLRMSKHNQSKKGML